MNTPASAVPSREAIETFAPSNGAMICCAQGTGHYVKTEDYRTLRAEVERLTARCTSTELMLKAERATVAEQGAALAELEKDMRNSIAHDGYRTVSTRCAPYTMVEEWSDRITALASAQSPKQTP